jgi:ABC-type glycerol-3-phosphate transport system substrate-binding protein
MLLAALGALCALVAGCGIGMGGGEQGSGGGGQEGGDGKLSGTITFQTLQLKPTFNDYINGVIKDFEEQNPGVKVKWVDIPFEGASQKVIADSSAGQLPDVINLNPDFALPLAQNDVFVNMDEAAADVKDRYIEGAWDAFVYPSLDYGVALPWYLSSEVTMYNGAYFEEAGLDPGKPPTTFDEMFADARQVAEKTDHYGMHPALDARFLVDLVKIGVPIVNEDSTEATFDTPEAVDYLEQMISLYKDGALPPDSAVQTQRDEIDAYQSGQIALFPSGPNFLGIIEENAPKVYEQTRVGPQVTGESGKVGMSAMGIMVPKSSDNQEAALAFAKFMTNAENQLAFAKVVTIFPSVESALEDPYFTKPREDTLEAEARRISAEQMKKAEVLRPVTVSDEFNQAVINKVQGALLGDLSPEEALSQAEQEATKILQRQAPADTEGGG